MPLQSAGILLYRLREGGPQVLLVHPGGPYHSAKDKGAWSIPKGLVEEGEDSLATARREFREELGLELPELSFKPLKPVRQKGGKIVHAWAAEGEIDTEHVQSNTFQMEYPYKSGVWQSFPEVDRAAWLYLAEAEEMILPAQVPLLAELAALLGLNK